jgi:hypothetical protein
MINIKRIIIFPTQSFLSLGSADYCSFFPPYEDWHPKFGNKKPICSAKRMQMAELEN